MKTVSGGAASQEDWSESVQGLGLMAFDALYDLSDISAMGRASRLTQADWSALKGLVNVEYAFAETGDGEISDEQRAYLHHLVHTYHCALPFSEAEREWIYELHDTTGIDWASEMSEQSKELVSSGIRKVVRGRDLMRRWWSWRRGKGEFEGQGTVDIAREALRELIETTAPEHGLPEPYVELRRMSGREPHTPPRD